MLAVFAVDVIHQLIDIIRCAQQRHFPQLQPGLQQEEALVNQLVNAVITEARQPIFVDIRGAPQQSRLRQMLRTFRALMPMQATDALNQQVNRRGAANHEVEIEVKALLNDLRGNQNCPFRALLSVFPKSIQHIGFDLAAPYRRETRVEEPDFISVNGLCISQEARHRDGFIHRITDDRDTPALPVAGQNCVQQAAFIRRYRFNRYRARLRPWQGMGYHMAVLRDHSQARVRRRQRVARVRCADSLQKRPPIPPRQGSGKQNHRRPQRLQPGEQTLDDNVHIAVITVYLVKDEYFVAQAELAHEVMPRLQDAQHRLINGADAVGRQERALAIPEPVLRGNATLIAVALWSLQHLRILCFLVRLTMYQVQIDVRLRVASFEIFDKALEHLIARGLRRHGDIAAAQTVTVDQQVGDMQRQLGLAAAGRILYKNQTRHLLQRAKRCDTFALQSIRLKREDLVEVRLALVRPPAQETQFAQRCPRLLPAALKILAQIKGARFEGEMGAVRPNPVTDGNEARDKGGNGIEVPAFRR